MKISLIHPSRGRPEKAKAVYDYWILKSSGQIQIEHILSLDFSDPTNESYGVFGSNSKIIIDHNDCVVEATNQAAKASTGDILVYLSDDFLCPDDWDKEIIQRFTMIDNALYDSPLILKINDCLQSTDKGIITMPIMNRTLFNKLKYLFNPKYKSMYADNDLYWTCKQNKWLMRCDDLKFPHDHHSIGKTPVDETYRRSEAHFEEGRKIFNQRKLEGFPI